MTGAAPPGAQPPYRPVRHQDGGPDPEPFPRRPPEPGRDDEQVAYEVVADLLARADGRRPTRARAG